ncbi:MAG: hypothetical protein U0359_18730 [Byssovorax sp.]
MSLAAPYLQRSLADPRIAWAYERLRSDPSAARAIEEGRLHDLYEIARVRLRTLADPAEREALGYLLAWRRNFLMPMSEADRKRFLPFVTQFHGRTEEDPSDGSNIQALCYVGFAYLPIWPIGQYVIRHAGGGSSLMSTRYEIFGKVPLADFWRIWRIAVLVALPVGALLLAVFVWLVGSRAHP